jgi:hypothetical protein
MPEMKLPAPYDGLPVVKTVVKIRKVGDGLSKAASTDPMTLHHGDEVDVIVRCVVASTTLKPLDDESPRGPQVACYDLEGTGKATIVDIGDQAITALLDAQQKRNDEAAGRPQLPLSPDDDTSVPSEAIDPNGAAKARAAKKATKATAKAGT